MTQSILQRMLFLIAMAAALLPAPLAYPQCNPSYDPGCIGTGDGEGPEVAISPGTGTYHAETGQSVQVPIEIVMTDVDGFRQWTLKITKTNGATSVPVSVSSWTPSAYLPRATATANVVLDTAGDNVITVEIADGAGAIGSGRATYRLEYDDPNLPVVFTDLVHNEYRNMTANAAVLTYSLPSYTSMGEERSVGLYYSSRTVKPSLFVQLDARPDPRSGSQVSAMSFRVTDNASNTAAVREVFYAKSSAAKQRLAGAAAMATTRPTGAYLYTAAVRSYWPDGSWKEKTVPIRALVINELHSRYGAGWSLLGVQRVHSSAQGVLLNEGNGEARWFAAGTCAAECVYTTPAGDFSSLIFYPSTATWVRRYPDGTRVSFDSRGLMTSIQDRFGRATNFEWQLTTDGQNVPVIRRIVDPMQKVTTFDYHPNWYLRQITDPAGRTAQFTYSGTDLVAITGDRTLRATYNADHTLSTYTTELGTSTIGYDQDTLGSVTAPAVLAGGVMTAPVTRYKSLQASSHVPPNQGTGLANLTAAVPSESALATITDPRGHATRMAVDRYGNPTKIIDPTGRTIENRWNVHGLPLLTSEFSGSQTTSLWNDRGQLILETVGGTTTYQASYDADVNPEYEYAGGVGAWKKYGPKGEVVRSWTGKKEDELRTATTYEYDALYRLVRRTGPTGERTEWSYGGNEWGNADAVRVYRADGTVLTTTFAYDTAGRTSLVTDPQYATTRSNYDALNRLVQVVDPAQRVTQYSYPTWTRTEITDAAGKTYKFHYNALGWLESEVFPDGKQRTYKYDLDGLLTSSTDRRGLSVSRSYDASHRITARTADNITTSYLYSKNRTDILTPETLVEFHYIDGVGELDIVANAVAGLVDMDGGWRTRGINVHSVRNLPESYAELGFDVKFWWNGGLARLESRRMYRDSTDHSVSSALTIRDFSGNNTTLGFDNSGRHVRTVFPNGVTESTSYTSDGQIASTGFSNSDANARFGATFTYDVHGRVSTRTSAAQDRVWSYGYDALGRIAQYEVSTSQIPSWCNPSYEECHAYLAPVFSEGYSYDAVGNRTDRGAVLQTASNRYAQFDGYTLEYDAEGNITRKYKAGFDQRLTWNSLGQLTSVTTNGATVSYLYNGLGNRVRRTENGQSRFFIYHRGELLFEVDSAGNPLFAYTYLPGVDRPLSVRTMSGGQNFTYYYALERPGHVNGIMNAAGQVAGELRYTPFGTPHTSSDAAGQPLRFMSRELDFSTGLYYVRNRWYDTALARFLSEDPIGMAGGINSYAYAANDPMNMRDPSGLSPECPNCLPTVYVSCNHGFDPDCDPWWEGGVFLQWSLQRMQTDAYEPGDFLRYGGPSRSLVRPDAVGMGAIPSFPVPPEPKPLSTIGPPDPMASVYRAQREANCKRFKRMAGFWMLLHGPGRGAAGIKQGYIDPSGSTRHFDRNWGTTFGTNYASEAQAMAAEVCWGLE